MSLPGLLEEEVKLTNGLSLFMFDQSHPMVGDRWVVKLLIQVPINLRRECLVSSDAENDPLFDEFIASNGWDVTFSYSKSRNFIDHNEVAQTLAELKTEFYNSMLPYVSRPNFEVRFVQRHYQNWCEEHRLKQQVLSRSPVPGDPQA